MKRWLADWMRTVGAWWWWNTRKTIFVARGRLGQCPCHNPSDSGAPGETRCEAVIFWDKPERFARRVCPLLIRNAQGDWVCGAAASAVRPFWTRVFVSHAIAIVAMVVVSGGLVWGGMRWVGYQVTLRQVFWPKAWPELRQVRGKLFLEKAEAALAAGQPREAITALLVARQLNPADYESAMILAQLLHVAQPDSVDGFYRQLMQQHPERANEIARVWCRSMLARGQMAGVAELSLGQLIAEPKAAAAWTHALLTAVRYTRNWALLSGSADDPKLPPETREVCALELRLRRTDFFNAKAILLAQPAPTSPYATLHRIERLIEFGDTFEALDQLRAARRTLAGRDVARLTLAAHAVGRNRSALERECGNLLDAPGAEGAAGVAIVAQHLIRYPDDALLVRCREAFGKLPADAPRSEAASSLFCAAALAGRMEWLPEIRKLFAGEGAASLLAQQKIEERLRAKGWSPFFLLSVVRPVTAELNYAVIERMIDEGAAAPAPAK